MSLPFIPKVPEATIVASPVYLAVAPGAMEMLPSMKIVPLTVNNFAVASHESSPSTVEPAFDWHVYVAPGGVRLIAVVGVALQLIELSGTGLAVSKIGGVPVLLVQGEYGPRSAFWYQ